MNSFLDKFWGQYKLKGKYLCKMFTILQVKIKLNSITSIPEIAYRVKNNIT